MASAMFVMASHTRNNPEGLNDDGPSDELLHVYPLLCTDDSLYVGHTHDLSSRVKAIGSGALGLIEGDQAEGYHVTGAMYFPRACKA